MHQGFHKEKLPVAVASSCDEGIHQACLGCSADSSAFEVTGQACIARRNQAAPCCHAFCRALSQLYNGLAQLDLPLLTKAHAEQPHDSRVVFYLAQTLDLIDDLQPALDMYQKRIDMRGWQQEIFEAHMRRVSCLLPALRCAML